MQVNKVLKGHYRSLTLDLVRVLLSVIAIGISFWLLMGKEAEVEIAYDLLNTTHLSQETINAIRADKSQAIDASSKGIIIKEIVANYDDVAAINNDTVGWLLIPNICYYPIMYNEVYDYYLKHNPYNNVANQGAIFINYQCDPSLDNMLTLVHGHNMLDNSMFGRLKEYLGLDFFQNNGPIMIYNGQSLNYYLPFTVVILEENNDVINARELSNLERTNYIQAMYERSLCTMKEGEEPVLTQPIIFFSTCNYSFSEARLLVGAYLIASEEVSR